MKRPALVAAGMALVLLSSAGPLAGAAAPAPLPRDRLEALSRPYLGVPYRLDPLGEGRGPDPDPLFTRAAVDCQTLVEQVMAEAIAPTAGGRDRALRLVRWRGGAPALEGRYHYCIPDWLENPWPAHDITPTLGPGARTASRRLDLPAFLKSRGGDARRSPHPARVVRYRYLPHASVPAVAPARLDGTVAVWVTDRRDTIAGHVGFLFRRGPGAVVFRHASQRRGRVVDEPLGAYLARAPRSVVGLIVLQPLVEIEQRPAL